MSYKAIAIDGPSGAGKSTLARAMAEKMGYLYVDTGAIYRTVGLAAKRHGVMLEHIEWIVGLLKMIKVELKYGKNGLQRMYLDGEDVTDEIRKPEISKYASAVSALPEVRAFLMEQQRGLARTNNVIMDGRDIGTVVLPGADLKIFLTASPEARATRRWKELQEKGIDQPYEMVLADIRERDFKDTNREAAPLCQAEGAVLVDTSEYNWDESLSLLLNLAKERLG